MNIKKTLIRMGLLSAVAVCGPFAAQAAAELTGLTFDCRREKEWVEWKDGQPIVRLYLAGKCKSISLTGLRADWFSNIRCFSGQDEGDTITFAANSDAGWKEGGGKYSTSNSGSNPKIKIVKISSPQTGDPASFTLADGTNPETLAITTAKTNEYVTSWSVPADAAGLYMAQMVKNNDTVVADPVFYDFDPTDTPSIQLVNARQRYPWNGKIDIDYKAAGMFGKKIAVKLISGNDEVVASASGLSGCTYPQDPNLPSRMTWDTAAEATAYPAATNIVDRNARLVLTLE